MGMIKPILAFVDLIKINQSKGMVVAEIGTYDGSTTEAYIDIIKQNNGHLYAVDWFNGNEDVEGPHAYNEDKANDVYNNFINNIHPYLDIITIKRGKSWDMIPEIPDNSLDICFIDADHRYSNVYKDIELCLPKIKPGGLLCGHDLEDINLANTAQPEWLEQDYVNGKHYGVIQAVYDHFKFDIVSIPDPNGQIIPIWVKQII
jgi:predicted O-methyltransferase YrrM